MKWFYSSNSNDFILALVFLYNLFTYFFSLSLSLAIIMVFRVRHLYNL